ASLDLVSLASAPTTDPDQPVRSISGVVAPARASESGVLRDVTFTVPLSDVPAGSYVARVVVRAGGEVVSDLRRQVEVVHGTRPAANDAPGATAGAAPSVSATATPSAKDVLHGGVVKQIVEQANRSDVAAVRQAANHAAGGRWSQVTPALAAVPAADPDARRL